MANKTVYSKSKRFSKQKFEDYLKTKFVDDYLRKNKDYFNSINSGIEDIFFGKEATEIYTDDTNIEQEDKIDICVKELGLQKAWSSDNKQEIYFAIECKRIEILSDSKNYVLDIQKFADREHTEFRLPFEGMMAFIENANLSHITLSKRITELLKATTTISTSQHLSPIKLYATFDGSYMSSHNKNFDNSIFSIYHLLLDYSTLVSD
ncbi:hypothetical protein ACQ86K_04880 [Mucilaginibacter sp. P19]|uniref:hypothetical protein n=1 Tax=Mucilaginibacter sp. P19 TaxID=3423947 RepID=UPI003D66586A